MALIDRPPGTGKTKTISGLVGKFLSERRTPIPTDGQKAIKPKLLVCAPSNAAIDEVCKRLLNGVPSSKGNLLHPTIVRIGIEKSVNISVKEVSLDSLVEAAVSASSAHGVGNDYTRIQAQQAELKDKITAKQNQIQVVHDFDDRKETLQNELHALQSERVALGVLLGIPSSRMRISSVRHCLGLVMRVWRRILSRLSSLMRRHKLSR
jgi:senataxin